MAENSDGDDLVALGLGFLYRSRDGFSVGQRRHLAEEVDDGHADLGGNSLSHGAESTACPQTSVRASVRYGHGGVSRGNRDDSVVIRHPRGCFSMLGA